MPRLMPAAAGHGFVAGGISSPASVQSKLTLFFFFRVPQFSGVRGFQASGFHAVGSRINSESMYLGTSKEYTLNQIRGPAIILRCVTVLKGYWKARNR